MRINLYFLILTAIFYSQLSFAQGIFSGSNMMEFQYGNLPNLEPKDQFSLYDQLNLAYRYKTLNAQIRIEQYYPSFGTDNKYFRLSQAKVQYRSKKLDLQVGNIYSSFGRGLLLRMYEIPGSIWETRGYRVRYGFYKDMLGGSAKINLNNLEVKVLGGKVLDVTLPPTISDGNVKDQIQARRPDLVAGAETSYRFNKQKVGLMYMRNETNNNSLGSEDDIMVSHYASINYEGILLNNLSVYSELAHKIEKGINVFSFDREAAYGGYIGLNYFINNIGASLEYKNYHNFFIGTGVNDPPTLVKEQSYRLLNRSTHVPILTDESGYQLEVYYNMKNGSLLTFNTSMARNEVVEGDPTYFLEFFGEYQFYAGDNISGKAFADYSRDPFINEMNRYATGGIVEMAHEKLSSTVELEWQMINRVTSMDVTFSNWYVNYTLSKASKFSASLLLEVTGDPVQVNEGKNHNFYPSTSFSYHINPKNIFTLFVGKRRGGPACNSGVCYDVLDFEGLEMRFSTRF